MKGSYLGPAYTNEEVLKVVRKYKASAVIIPDEDELLEMAAEEGDEASVAAIARASIDTSDPSTLNRKGDSS